MCGTLYVSQICICPEWYRSLNRDLIWSDLIWSDLIWSDLILIWPRCVKMSWTVRSWMGIWIWSARCVGKSPKRLMEWGSDLCDAWEDLHHEVGMRCVRWVEYFLFFVFLVYCFLFFCSWQTPDEVAKLHGSKLAEWQVSMFKAIIELFGKMWAQPRRWRRPFLQSSGCARNQKLIYIFCLTNRSSI